MTDDDNDAELEERGMGLEDVFGGSNEAETSGTSETLESSEASQSLETIETQEMVPTETEEPTANTNNSENAATNSESSDQSKIARENKNVNMFLNAPTYKRLMTTYKQLDGEYYAQHETDLEKNRQYFDAVINTGLEHLDEVRHQIGLE